MANAVAKVEAIYQVAVSCARDDGADELHGPCPRGRLRGLGRHSNYRTRPGGGGEGYGSAVGKGRGSQSPDWRRLRPAAGNRRRRSRCRDRRTRGRSRQGRVDARGRHPARYVPAVFPRPVVRRARREGNADRLEQSLRWLLDPCEISPARIQQWSRPRHHRWRDQSRLRPAEHARGVYPCRTAGHSDRLLAQRRTVAQCLCDREFHRRTRGHGEAGSGRLSAVSPRRDAPRQSCS